MKILYKEEIMKALKEDNVEQLEVYLRAAIKRKIDEGYNLAPGRLHCRYISGKKTCCAIGAIVEIEKDNKYYYGEIDCATLFNFAFDVECIKLADIAVGFDCPKPFDDYGPFLKGYVQLGFRLRKEFYKENI